MKITDPKIIAAYKKLFLPPGVTIPEVEKFFRKRFKFAHPDLKYLRDEGEFFRDKKAALDYLRAAAARGELPAELLIKSDDDDGEGGGAPSGTSDIKPPKAISTFALSSFKEFKKKLVPPRPASAALRPEDPLEKLRDEFWRRTLEYIKRGDKDN